ncbi:MAG TPA: hypothetical protein PKK43_05735 [Spirochaetota bacterium]|nr:hypothetical protein [Spirochaetota bacterium]
MYRVLLIIIAASAVFTACDSSPMHVTSVTTIYGPDDHDCAGMPVRSDKTTTCHNIAECPEDEGCSEGSDGFHQKTKYICNSTDACDENNRSPENE